MSSPLTQHVRRALSWPDRKNFAGVFRILEHILERSRQAEARQALETERLWREVHLLREAVGRVESRQIHAGGPAAWEDAEFRAFSQGGEDGLLDLLARRVAVPSRTFIEIGVEDYREANTRFLLLNRHWEGHVVDGGEEHVAAIRRQWVTHYERLKAYRRFVTRESINEILAEAGLPEEFGLFSLDIDGNDYWVWRAVAGYRPTLCAVEYNWRFGPDRAVSIPYDPAFRRADAHRSMLYYGASLAALVRLGEARGYAFVGCNANGVNAFFVRRDRLPDDLPALTAAQGFRAGTFSEYRDEQGEIVKLGADGEAEFLAGLDLPLVEDPET